MFMLKIFDQVITHRPRARFITLKEKLFYVPQVIM